MSAASAPRSRAANYRSRCVARRKVSGPPQRRPRGAAARQRRMGRSQAASRSRGRRSAVGAAAVHMGWAGGTCGQPIGEKFRYHVRYPPLPSFPATAGPSGEACFCRFLFLQRTRDYKGDIRRSIAKYNITEIARASTLDSHTHTTHNERTSASGERS